MCCTANNIVTKKTADYKIAELNKVIRGNSKESNFDWVGEIETFEKLYLDS